MKNTATSDQTALDRARDYEHKRFQRSRRMRRTDSLEKEFAQRLRDIVGADSCVVDLPCGSGRFFQVFSGVRELVMADHSESMLQVVRERYGSPENTRILQADILDIPLPDGTADLCFCMRLFHLLDRQVIQKALAELARVSKRYVALSFYNRNSARYYWRRAWGKKRRSTWLTLNELLNLAKEVGLKPVGTSGEISFLRQEGFVLLEKG